MPVILNGTTVPDYPGDNQEACHYFCGNYILQSRYATGVYVSDGESPVFISKVIQQFGLIHSALPIQQGDLLLFGPLDAQGHVVNFTHSMIAINADIWFGVNNTNTFGPLFIRHGIPVDSLSIRREINVASLVPARTIQQYLIDRNVGFAIFR